MFRKCFVDGMSQDTSEEEEEEEIIMIPLGFAGGH
jgi:hypothetical protein